jgi:hypothetical protein
MNYINYILTSATSVKRSFFYCHASDYGPNGMKHVRPHIEFNLFCYVCYIG